MLFAVSLATAPLEAATRHLNLPSLGDTASAEVSIQKEQELKQIWLMNFRAKAPLIDDPVTTEYLEQLLTKLAAYSKQPYDQLNLFVVNNKQMNAFAVPGGVIGVHNGLFRYAKTEDQLASILSHELAHLSQRHYARSLAQQRSNRIPTMAGMLAGILLVAAGSADVGIAAVQATQAASLQNSLRYSRLHELEADRIGLQTLADAGMNPYAASEMFEQMLAASRLYTTKPPEFLLTHPLTERRVSEAASEAERFDRTKARDTLEFDLVQVRAQVQLHNNAAESRMIYQEKHEEGELAASYGYALALRGLGLQKTSLEIVEKLSNQYPRQISLIVSQIELMLDLKDLDAASNLLNAELKQHPESYALKRLKAKYFEHVRQFKKADIALTQLAEERPFDADIWYSLAEIRGLGQNIVGLHRARAEYFILNGGLQQARKQLHYALKEKQLDYHTRLRINQRLIEISELQHTLENFN